MIARPAHANAAARGACATAGLALGLALASLASSAAHARAQEGPYSNYLVGERSLGLAGAFVGLADDPSAIFHNPGGTARLPTSAASGSLWALVRGSRDVEHGYRTDLGATDLDYSAPLALPLFLAGVVKFGAAQKDGVRPHALGAALFTPYSDERRFVVQLDTASAVDRLEVRHNDRARWLGISYAYRLEPGLSLGVSAFWAMRSLDHDEVELRAREDLPTNSAVGSTHSRSSTLSIDTDHAVARVGLLLELRRDLRAGVMFQPPGFQFADSVETEHVVTDVGPNPTRIELDHHSSGGANLPMPWELRMGVTWLRSVDTLVTIDLSLFGPIGTSRDPLPLVENQDVQLGVLVPENTYRRTTLRGAIGFQTVFADLLPIRGGLFFERSAAPVVPPTSNAYALDRMSSVGFALSLGVRTGGYDLAVGSTAVPGFGDGLALVRGGNLDAPPRYELSSVKNTMVMIYLGGAKSAVKELVSTLSD
jgi:hypothetical protein